jgi:hypothetical protein
MSSFPVLLYNVQEFQPQEKPIPMVKKQVLFGFTSNGWQNNGVNFDKVRWYLIDEGEWIKMMTPMLKLFLESMILNWLKTDW